jgi:hypothetical protein
MRESCMYGSARGALSNGCPYRNRGDFITLLAGGGGLNDDQPRVAIISLKDPPG